MDETEVKVAQSRQKHKDVLIVTKYAEKFDGRDREIIMRAAKLIEDQE